MKYSGEDRLKAKRKLTLARGQLNGIINMIDEGRYCIEISTQILAALALLKGANIDVLKGHMKSCLLQSAEEGESSYEAKVDELLDTFGKYTR